MIDNISLYISFKSVADHGSISAAARSQYISQPALSAEIQQLETKLGCSLFFRTSRGMNLTEEGIVLYDYVTKALSFLDAGEEKIKDSTGLKSGTLKIGASDMTLKFCLLDFITQFRDLYPDIRLRITNAPTPSTLNALRSGLIDFGVISGTKGIETKYDDLEFIAMKKINDIFVVSPSSPLAKEKNVQLERLNDFPLIALDRETSTREFVFSITGDRLDPPDIELATSELVLEFARKGYGVSSVVRNFAEDDIKKGSLVMIDMADPLPPRKIYLTFLSKLPLSAAARRMISMMKENRDNQL